ncbi:hypothetical protein HMSSN036_28840 [Paenibacillus macerans]|nr:hypothetical protein HMSSN036_28840 [Paenibacillus macerans]
MRSGGYNLPFDNMIIAEGNDTNQWMDEEDRANSPQAVTLEDEIHLLRSKMEKIFLQEKSFTSDVVIEISSLLDLKINEFMKTHKKSKKWLAACGFEGDPGGSPSFVVWYPRMYVEGNQAALGNCCEKHKDKKCRYFSDIRPFE